MNAIHRGRRAIGAILLCVMVLAAAGCELFRSAFDIRLTGPATATVGQPVEILLVFIPLDPAHPVGEALTAASYDWTVSPVERATVMPGSDPASMTFVAVLPGTYVVTAVGRTGEIAGRRADHTISVADRARKMTLTIETTIKGDGFKCPGVVTLEFWLAGTPGAEAPNVASLTAICTEPSRTAYEASGTFDQRTFELSAGQWRFSGTLDGDSVKITGGPRDQTFRFSIPG